MSKRVLQDLKIGICLFIISWFLAASPAQVLGQKPEPVLTWKAGTTFNAYLLRGVQEGYDQRRAEVAKAMTSKAGMEAYQAMVKQKYQRLLGQFPEKQAVNAKITKSILQKGFRVENLIYESRPNHHVTANLYIPEGRGPFPAVLLMNGHEMTAKATESYQKTARLLALHGFVVLSVDPFSQGERVQLTDSTGKSLTRGATTEHTLLNAGANLVGTSVAAYMLWDNVRALDYLETRPEVDKTRLGAIGNSGGGTQTAYLLAYDDRIKVAVPCSFFTQRERYLEVAGPQDGCQFMPGEDDLEIADFILAAAPKPVLILAGENDFVDHRGTQQAFQELQGMYATLQKSSNLKLFVYPDGHGISKPKREVAVSWFRQWFYNDSKEVKEGEIGALSEEALQATSTGQVTTEYPREVTIQELNTAKSQQLAAQRAVFMEEKDLAVLRSKVAQVIGFSRNQAPVFTELTDSRITATYKLEKRIIMRAGEMPIPALVYIPSGKAKPKNVVIRLATAGKESLLKTDSLVLQEMKAGNVLILADLRGMGESKDDPRQNDSKYWNDEYRNAILSLHIQKSILTQRVQDIVTVLDFVSTTKTWGKLPVTLNADGVYGPVVTHATFLDTRISKAVLTDSLVSYGRYVQQPLQKNMYSNLVQGILQFYDLPDLIKKSNGRIKLTQL